MRKVIILHDCILKKKVQVDIKLAGLQPRGQGVMSQ